MLHVDIPTREDFKTLVRTRSDACVSIYLPTKPQTQHVNAARTELGNLSKEALRQLEAIGFDKRRLAVVAEQIDDLMDDESFWAFQAHALAVLITPDVIRTYRLPNQLHAMVQVSESVRKVSQGLHSLRSIIRIAASRRNANALYVRFSKSLANRRHRLSHASVRSTTHRRGRTSKPFAWSDRLMISTERCGIAVATASWNLAP